MDALIILFLLFILILLIWNIKLFYTQKKKDENYHAEYYELHAKLNFITAVGSIAILLISYLGFNVKKEILKNSEEPINKMVKLKSSEIDSLLNSKNILKAGIYIVNDLEFEEKKEYKFQDLKTIDNKSLPVFHSKPKLIINTNTGENLRIEKITTEFFVLDKSITKSVFITDPGASSQYYPEIIKFDVWIADYNTN